MNRRRLKSVYLYGPKSFLTLVLVGFAVVTLPLAAALIYAAVYLDRLANESQRTVYQAVQTTQSGHSLMSQLTAMERTARQYQVLGDAALLTAYNEQHRRFQDSLSQLADIASERAIVAQLQTLASQETSQYDTLSQQPPRSEANTTAIAEFATLNNIAQSTVNQSADMIDRHVDAMQQTTSQAQQVFLWLALALVPGALLFAGVFTVLVARPIKQIDRAIRRLGAGNFAGAIHVTGPQDLEYLGRRLDWLRERLLDHERQKNRFIRHVSHELKTPLTALREGAELLADEVVGDLLSEQKEVVAILRQNSLRLQKLIEDLLQFSQAEMQLPLITHRPVALDQIVRRVLEDHKLSITSKGIQLKSDLTNTVIMGDEEKLRIIVDNLISNAIKHSPIGGTVRIHLHGATDTVILDITDSGPGINADEAERIFEAFYQGSSASDGYVKGSGLGLSITREHVLSHQGQIEALTDTDEGAHFRVTLPISEQGSRADAA